MSVIGPHFKASRRARFFDYIGKKNKSVRKHEEAFLVCSYLFLKVHPLMDDIRVDQMLIDESMLSDQNLNSVAFLWDDQRDCSQVMSWNDFIEQIQTSATWKSLDLQREILVPVRSVPSPRARTRHLPKWIQTSCFNDAQEGGNFEFQGLKFSCDFSTLAAQNQRIMCPKCRETRKFYCYDCLIPLSETIPRVSLPVNLCMYVLNYRYEHVAHSRLSIQCPTCQREIGQEHVSSCKITGTQSCAFGVRK